MRSRSGTKGYDKGERKYKTKRSLGFAAAEPFTRGTHRHRQVVARRPSIRANPVGAGRPGWTAQATGLIRQPEEVADRGEQRVRVLGGGCGGGGGAEGGPWMVEELVLEAV